MKGRTATLAQKHFHGLMADVVGCIACRKDGGFTDYVSIHHIDGRTKPNAHWLVLPLCGGHHQDLGWPDFIPVHPYKAQFEAKYGKQMALLQECIELLTEGGFIVPEEALNAAGMEKQNPATVDAVPGLSTAQT